MARELNQDELDLIDALKETHRPARGSATLAAWAEAKMKSGIDARDLAALLRYEANKIEGWCRGRFG